jgi:hypothetical protein
MRLWNTTFLCRFKVKFIIRFDREKGLYARPRFTRHFSEKNEVKKNSFRGRGTLMKALKMPNGLVDGTAALCETSATSCGTLATSWVVLEVVALQRNLLRGRGDNFCICDCTYRHFWRLRPCLRPRQPQGAIWTS